METTNTNTNIIQRPIPFYDCRSSNLNATCFNNERYTPDKDSDEPDFIFLIALGGLIFELDDSLSVLMRDDGIYGIGSGSPYAIGALQAGAT